MKEFDNLMKKVDYLVRINPLTIHPPLSQLGKPALKSSYKPISKEKARSDLLKLGPEEIERLYNEEIEKQKEQNEKEEKGRYFNQPSYNADFNYWGKQPYWTIEEGIFLLLEKDPRKIKWENLRQHVNVSPFAKKFEEILELARRYVACGQLNDAVTPGVFLAWASRMDFQLPEKLQETVNTLGIQITDWQERYKEAMKLYRQQEQMHKQAIELLNEKDHLIELLNAQLSIIQQRTDKPENDIKETERQSLYKIIAATVYSELGYIPTEKKSKIPNEITNAVTEYLGETIDSDTVRKWLHAACDKYPKLIQ